MICGRTARTGHASWCRQPRARTDGCPGGSWTAKRRSSKRLAPMATGSLRSSRPADLSALRRSCRMALSVWCSARSDLARPSRCSISPVPRRRSRCALADSKALRRTWLRLKRDASPILGAGSGAADGLKRYTGSSVNIRRGDFIYSFDKKGCQCRRAPKSPPRPSPGRDCPSH